MIEAVLSNEGWPYASAPPVEPGDPGRFHALFGRDALITALQLLPERPEIASATLWALTLRQGRRTDPATLEEPGKIGHEFREAPPASFVAAGWPPGGAFSYYGTADATAWFLVLLAASGVAGWEEERDAAAVWLANALDAGDGLVRHAPGTFPGGLVQQGWGTRSTRRRTRVEAGTCARTAPIRPRRWPTRTRRLWPTPRCGRSPP